MMPLSGSGHLLPRHIPPGAVGVPPKATPPIGSLRAVEGH